ncbi:MAG: PKD domain-containing protein [Chloroflexota bacterium]|nr:PKD domain-containing protein [Chloroflexota bacterium]
MLIVKALRGTLHITHGVSIVNTETMLAKVLLAVMAGLLVGTAALTAFPPSFALAAEGAQAPAAAAPVLPPEYTTLVLDPVHPVPNPESGDYLVVNTVTSNREESFNHLSRHTRSIAISGKTVVFRKGHENGLYSLNGNNDIKELKVYAERVVIGSPLHLPQTNVTIYARTLRFEGDGCINTTPRSLTHRPAQFAPGKQGLKAGDVSLFIEDCISAPGYTGKRLIMRGGAGQDGGKGQRGAAGQDLPAFIEEYPDQKIEYLNVFSSEELVVPWANMVIHVVVHDKYGSFCNQILFEWGNSEDWPGNGQDGKKGGQPGNGGDGGILRTNVSLHGMFDISNGSAGEGSGARGGRAGRPQTALKLIFDGCSGEDAWVLVGYKESGSGHDAVAPKGKSGKSGSYKSVSDHWLHPNALRMILAYADDAYLYRHVDVARETLEDYIGIIETYKASAEWDGITETWRLEFQRMQREMQILLHRMDNNLDYFGNSPGWVPMLSFEVNRAAFDDEIERAVRLLYLCYWVENSETDVQGKVDALSSAREETQEEIGALKTQYDKLVKLIPDLKVDIEAIAAKTDDVREQLKQVEEELIERAQRNVEEKNKVPFWRKALRILGTVVSLCPVGQPYTGLAGGGLTLISNMEFDAPWDSIDDLADIAKVDFVKYGKDCEALGSAIAKIPDTLSAKSAQKYVADIAKKAEPVAREISKYKDVLKQTEAPKNEVEAELAKIRASDPVFNNLLDEIAELMARKESLAEKLAQSMQAVPAVADSITSNLLAIDSMNGEIFEGKLALDHRASVYAKELGRQATHRLRKYHYYMAKAYEYRFLEPYEGDLCLDNMFNKMGKLVDQASSGAHLSAGEYDALKALYEAELSVVVAKILDDYNSSPPERSVPRRFNLSQDIIQELNESGAVTINMVDMCLFPSIEENIRIAKLVVDDITAHPEGGDLGNHAHLDIDMKHSGVSRLVHEGEVYGFNHHNSLNSEPLAWTTRYDGLDDTLESVEPSAASNSLLRSLIVSKDQELLLYSRPAAWADITLTKKVNTDNGVDLVIDSLRMEVIYDFTASVSSKVTVQVGVSEEGMLPQLKVDKKDMNGRQDGMGPLRRTYDKKLNDTVTIEAPTEYGMWRFQRWTDLYGNDVGDDPTNPIIRLGLNDDRTVVAQMAKHTPPVAEFTCSPREKTLVHQEVALDASASHDPNGSIKSWEWAFGDGTTATGESVTHSFADAGTYSITLNVTDYHDMSTEATELFVVEVPYVNVAPSLPTIAITPDFPDTADDLVYQIITQSNDADGDDVTYLCEWYRNGALQSGMIGDTVQRSNTNPGDKWKCVVTASDGNLESGCVSSETMVFAASRRFSSELPRGLQAVKEADAEISFTGTGDVNGSIGVLKYEDQPVLPGVEPFVDTQRQAIKFVGIEVNGFETGMAHVRLHYAGDEVQGLKETGLGIYYWGGNGWKLAQGCSVDVENNVVSADIRVSSLSDVPLVVGWDELEEESENWVIHIGIALGGVVLIFLALLLLRRRRHTVS